MNWYHGPESWSELERVLSGQPRAAENPYPGDVATPGLVAQAWPSGPGGDRREPRSGPAWWGVCRTRAPRYRSAPTGPPLPNPWPRQRRNSGSALAITDHDGLYGVVPRRAAASSGCPPCSGRNVSRGEHLLVLASGEATADSRDRPRSPARRRQGEPRYDLRARRHAGGHWYILTGCRTPGSDVPWRNGTAASVRHAAAARR